MPDQLPPPLMPMLATAGAAPAGAGYGFEFKWDGMRALVSVAGRRIRVLTRNGKDAVDGYPELSSLVGLCSGQVVTLDGEIVALDSAGVPQFALLQRRMHVAVPTVALAAAVPVRFFVFDVLHLDRPVTGLAYRDRRELLDSLDLRDPVVDVPPSFTGVSGRQMLEVARANRMEGVVAKQLESRYTPGVRSPAWIKSALFTTAEIVVCGWTPGGGHRTATIGSLLMGMYGDGTLHYVGNVGTGFRQQELRMLLARFGPLERPWSPFAQPPPAEYARQARWLAPVLVGEVGYRTFTQDGRLRHPTWRGLRSDRDPDEARLPG